MRVAVVVLGDLGRSPRMLYHAQALAAQKVDVDLVGYVDSPLPQSVRDDPKIVVHAVGGVSGSGIGPASRGRYLARALWRGVWVSTRLTTLLLWRLARPHAILVQNPPGVPVLLVAWVASRVRSASFLIDWHNLTYSMLSLRVGPAHALVRMARWYEGSIGRTGDLHLFVSKAMQEALGAQWRLRGIVFRDRPAGSFESIGPVERDRIRQELCARLDLPPAPAAFAMAVSPTSWTADEDFGLLIEAVSACESMVRDREVSGVQFPQLLVLLTGRGPLREHYERRIAGLESRRIHLRTIWLASEEYPKVLAAADLGLCVHRSASGLDLPMKVADMFGAGIPVCALNYGPCLSELVHHGVNGLLFSTPEELARQLLELFSTAPAENRSLGSLRRGAMVSQADRWQDAWNREVWPALSSLQGDS